MKKLLGFAVLLVVLIFVGRQVYWMTSEGGNLNVYACNSSDLEEVTLEVFIDGESVFIEDHTNEKFLDYKGLALYRSMGTHEVKVVAVGKEISKTSKFNLRTVKWINIEFANDENDPSQYDLQMSVESSPIVIE
ncbi:MAG: hypothetical protein RLN90_07385 [Balneolaceae bacterium]